MRVRWHSLFHNVDVSVRHLDALQAIVEEFQTQRAANVLLQNSADNQLVEDLISSSLVGTLLGVKWPQVAKKQLKSDFLMEQSKLQLFADEVGSTKTSVIELYEPFFKPYRFN